MERYSVITKKFPREFVLLQGTGCKWGKCTFCDYHTDTSRDPYSVNREVLDKVTGEFGVLDVINSGSCFELDEHTVAHLQRIVAELGIGTLWFEVHWMYRRRLDEFAALFPGVEVKFRCGVETFDAALREKWNKGIPAEVDAREISRHFQGVCLMCCTQGEDFSHIEADIEIACRHFEYMSVNVFCSNTTSELRDDEMVGRFMREIYPKYAEHPKIEILVENTDLGVGA